MPSISGRNPINNEYESCLVSDKSLHTKSQLDNLVKQKGTDIDPFDTGVILLAVRKDDDAPEVANGKLAMLQQDELGRLKVATQPGGFDPVYGSITGSSQTVVMNVERISNVVITMVATSLVGHNISFEYSNNSSNGTDGNWYSTQVVRSNANTVEVASGVLAATPVYGWEASVNAYKWFRVRSTAHTSGTAAYTFRAGAYATEPIPAIQVTGTQAVSGTVALTTPAASNINSAATTNATVIKSSAGTLFNVIVSNSGASKAYLKFYNKTTAPTVGTDIPVMVMVLDATSTTSMNFGVLGHRFTTGIGIAITGAMADNDTTAVAASQVKVLTGFV